MVSTGNCEELLVYSDADFAGDTATRKSIMGYLSILAGAPVLGRYTVKDV